MRVLVVARGYPTPQDPENGIFEYEHALALAKRGVQVSYIYIDRRTRVSKKICRRLGLGFHNDEYLDVYGGFQFPIPFRFFPRIANWLYSRRYVKAAKRIIDKCGMPDVIQSHYLFNLPCAVAVKEEFGIPLVATEHWSKVVEPGIDKCVSLYSEFYKFADKVICVSNSLKNAVESKFRINSSVIFNIVSDSLWDKKLITGRKGDILRFVSIGSLCHRKGFDILIDSLCVFDKIMEIDWSLTIIGDGGLKEALIHQINECDLSDRIRLVGRKNRSEISEYLSYSDVFVLPTRSETFGVVFIEAMSCGLPVIATVCGGPEEFVTPEVGSLISVENKKELVDALVFMSEHHHEFDREYIVNYCKNNFSSEIIIPQYIRQYTNVIEG